MTLSPTGGQSFISRVIPEGSILFNMFVNYSGTESTLNKSADNTKLGKVADKLKSCAAIQSDVNRVTANSFMGG